MATKSTVTGQKRSRAHIDEEKAPMNKKMKLNDDKENTDDKIQKQIKLINSLKMKKDDEITEKQQKLQKIVRKYQEKIDKLAFSWNTQIENEEEKLVMLRKLKDKNNAKNKEYCGSCYEEISGYYDSKECAGCDKIVCGSCRWDCEQPYECDEGDLAYCEDCREDNMVEMKDCGTHVCKYCADSHVQKCRCCGMF
eukprot:539016_1